MSKKAAISFGLAVLALLVAPVVFGADGPPNLGTAAVTGQDGPTRWYIDARIFDNAPDQDDFSNRTLSIGILTPVNDSVDFWLGYSSMDGRGADPINNAVRESDRDVITVAMKKRLNSAGSNCAWTLTLGADVATSDATTGTNLGTGFVATQDSFTPAAKLQIEWGEAGKTQFQLAGQVAWWDDTVPTSVGTDIPNYGTVSTVGGGLVWPISSRLAVSGDAVFCLGSDNYVTETNTLDDQVVWSAGGSYDMGDSKNTTLSAYATNSMSPTIAGAGIAASDDGVALGLSLWRDL